MPIKVTPVVFVNNYMHILHQNIAGLINKSDMLLVNLDELKSAKINIDVLCITEHFIESNHEELLRIPNYQLAACYSRDSKRGGTCILLRTGHQFKELPDIAKHSISGIFECCAIELIAQKTVVVCIYRTPKYSHLSIFYEKLDIILKKICNKTARNVVICGDFNVDILKNNYLSLQFEYFLLGYNLELEIRQPTRLSSNTCIDNFAHNIKHGHSSKVLELGLSDHTAQVFKFPAIKACTIDSWRVERRDYSNENLTMFKQHLESLSFADVYNAQNPNAACDAFLDCFTLLYDLCFPVELKTIRTKTKMKWLSRGIRVCSKRQRQLLWRFRHVPTEENKKLFRSYSQKYRKIIKLTQKAQNNYKINVARNKSKATWNVINSTKANYPKDHILKVRTDGYNSNGSNRHS